MKLVRPDIQASRQVWFRSVTAVGDQVSRECTKSIMCRMSCQDSFSDPRPDYPEILPNDTPTNEEYVEAINSGEGTCLKRVGRKQSWSCWRKCIDKYPSCRLEMAESKLVALYHRSARVFHTIGMNTFDFWWWVQDRLKFLGGVLPRNVTMMAALSGNPQDFIF